jgi:uncharacterized protein YbjT (DUF2867 family)
VIVGILDNPEQHRANAYPALWPVEYTYPEIAEVLSRALGKKIQYQQIDLTPIGR